MVSNIDNSYYFLLNLFTIENQTFCEHKNVNCLELLV